MKTRNILGTALITTALLTGCGGGGGGDDSTPSQDQQALQALSGYNEVQLYYNINQAGSVQVLQNMGTGYGVLFESPAVVNCTALGYVNPQRANATTLVYEGPNGSRCAELDVANDPQYGGNLNFATGRQQ